MLSPACKATTGCVVQPTAESDTAARAPERREPLGANDALLTSAHHSAADLEGRRLPIPALQYPQTSFLVEPGIYLRLRRPLELEFDPECTWVTVRDWSIKLDLAELPDLGRHVVRRFQRLLRKAEQAKLSEQEEAEWRNIVTAVDYDDYCLSRMVAEYVEGVVTHSGDFVEVEWLFAGQKERLDWQVAQAVIRLCDKDDCFGGYATFNRDRRTRTLERLEYLGPLGEIMTETEPDWPRSSGPSESRP